MKYTLFLLALICITMQTQAQQCEPACISAESNSACCNEVISTDPEFPLNTERPEYRNRFDWRLPVLSALHPPDYFINGGPLLMQNPFWNNTESHLSHISFYNWPTHIPRDPAKTDFHPADGWELIHRHFGYEPDELTPVDPIYQRIGPYMILYNKYTGTLRLLASFNFEPNNEILANIAFKPDPLQVKKTSAMLSLHNGVARALDKVTEITQVGRAVPFSAGRGFFVADYPMAYDPCICSNQSELDINFDVVNVSRIQLDGRFVATSVPLTGAGVWPLLNSRDFMLAVHRDNNFNIKAGALTYSNINSLVNKYKSPPAMDPMEKLMLDAFSFVLKSGASAADTYLSGKVTPYVKQFVANSISVDPQSLKGLKIGLGIFSAGADQLISSITPAKPAATPNIHFIEGEMSLTGTATSTTALNNGSITLKTPGSLESNNPDVHWTNYPAYNEPLGIFALTQTPKVILDIRQPPFAISPQGPYPFKIRMKLEEDLKYYFNKSAEVDLEKTRISAGFELSYLDMANQVDFGGFQRVLSANNANTIATDFYPINCFQSISHELSDESNDIILSAVLYGLEHKFYIKFIIDCVYKENRYGKTNRALLVFKYPVEIAYGTQLDLFETNIANTADFADVMNYNTPTFFNSTTVKHVWNDVQISDEMSSASGSSAIIKAGSSITLLAGAVIGSDVELSIGLPTDCAPGINPICDEDIKAFCASSTYRANQTLSKTGDSPNRINKRTDQGFELKIYPNPAKEMVYISSEAKEDLTIQVFDHAGRLIETVTNGSKGLTTIATNGYEPGIYFCKVTKSNGRTQTEKIVVIR